MGLIYRLAEETVVWLGDKSDNSDSAIDFIKFLHELSQKTSTDQELQKYLRNNPKPAKWNIFQNLFLRQ
jgi:hypothetical protein